MVVQNLDLFDPEKCERECDVGCYLSLSPPFLNLSLDYFLMISAA